LGAGIKSRPKCGCPAGTLILEAANSGSSEERVANSE
jgi:hypothetical protein